MDVFCPLKMGKMIFQQSLFSGTTKSVFHPPPTKTLAQPVTNETWEPILQALLRVAFSKFSPTFLRYQFLKLITADGNVLRASSSLESVGLRDGDAVTVTWLGLFEETDGEATEKNLKSTQKGDFFQGAKKFVE